MKNETALKFFNFFTTVLIHDAASSSDPITVFLKFSVHNAKRISLRLRDSININTSQHPSKFPVHVWRIIKIN